MTAFEEVYETFAGEVRLWVARIFAAPFEREEAVQEVWLMVHRMFGSFDPARGPLRPWLRAVTVNRCRELLRAKGRRPLADEEVDEALADRAPLPDEVAERTRWRAAIEVFGASLDPEEREVLTLALVEGRTHEEVASAMGISTRRSRYLKQKVLARAHGDQAIASFRDAADGQRR